MYAFPDGTPAGTKGLWNEIIYGIAAGYNTAVSVAAGKEAHDLQAMAVLAKDVLNAPNSVGREGLIKPLYTNQIGGKSRSSRNSLHQQKASRRGLIHM